MAGHSIIDGALVVSLAPMREVRVDPEQRLAHAGGGALWDDVDAAAFAHGLAVPGGTFGDTGIGGLTLGGGIGWLMPVAGLTCDNLVEAQVVTADGDVVIAGPATDPDLLWALRGGGGNFGIVTRFTYRLRPVELLFGGIIRYPAAAARAVLARVEEVIAGQPNAMLPTLTLQSDPELGSLVKLSFAIVDGADPGPFVDRLVRDLPVVAAATGPLTYLELQALAGRMPFGLRNYWKGHGLRTLDPDLFEEIARGIGGPDELGSSFVMFEGIVGAGRMEPEGGAAFGQRAARWNGSALAIWEEPGDDVVAIGWARRVAEQLEPWSVSGGGYVNYSPFDEPAERVQAAYGAERWERLVVIKRRLDPDNVFRFNHNIDPL